MSSKNLHHSGNLFGLWAISSILLFAFTMQFYHHELPCPLCLLQRVCFIAVGLCLVMNLRFGIRPSHYRLMLSAAVLGLMVAARQVYLHWAPNDAGYGSPFWGFYLYQWSALAFLLIIGLTIGAMLLKPNTHLPKALTRLTKTALLIFLFLILANAVMAFLECGSGVCPDDPIRYALAFW